MLVAKKGKVILDQGYGMANRAAHIPNGPNTEYGLANATTTALLTAVTLQGTWPRLPCCRISDSTICGPRTASCWSSRVPRNGEGSRLAILSGARLGSPTTDGVGPETVLRRRRRPARHYHSGGAVLQALPTHLAQMSLWRSWPRMLRQARRETPGCRLVSFLSRDTARRARGEATCGG